VTAKRVVVSLISDQTIPNILAIHHFKPDELLFVSTQDMENKGKTSAILGTLRRLGLDYSQTHSVVTVREDSIVDCEHKLNEWIGTREGNDFIVNLTCGTKIMSVAAYEYFKDYGAQMIYVPIPRNEFITPFPKRSSTKAVPFSLRLSVTQYLAAYGLKVANESKLATYKDVARGRQDLTRWIMANYLPQKDLMCWFGGHLRAYRSAKEYFLMDTFSGASGHERELLDRLGFTVNGGTVSKHLSRSLITYLTGGWLEEFCFNEVCGFIGRGVDDAVLGLKLVNSLGRENEFDVMFTKDNTLYFVECKSLDLHEVGYADVLYKIGALQKDFGLRVESFLVTTAENILAKDGTLREAVAARAEQFRTTVIPPSDVARFGERLSLKLGMQGHGD
jgi:hypothetical protein